MASHEIPQNTNVPDYHEEAHRHTLEDNAGFSVYEADISLGGTDPDRVPYRKPHGRTHRVSHRGGRSYPEAADAELDPNWNVQPAQLTDEERAAGRAGYLAARAAIDMRADQKYIERLHAEAHAAELRGEDIHPGALWRAHQEKRRRARGV
jgi:hypothetical protein